MDNTSLCLFLLHIGVPGSMYRYKDARFRSRKTNHIHEKFSILCHLLLHFLDSEVNDHTGCEKMLLGQDTLIRWEPLGPAVRNFSFQKAARTERRRQ
jgi:hypothetical protein